MFSWKIFSCCNFSTYSAKMVDVSLELPIFFRSFCMWHIADLESNLINSLFSPNESWWTKRKKLSFMSSDCDKAALKSYRAKCHVSLLLCCWNMVISVDSLVQNISTCNQIAFSFKRFSVLQNSLAQTWTLHLLCDYINHRVNRNYMRAYK